MIVSGERNVAVESYLITLVFVASGVHFRKAPEILLKQADECMHFLREGK